MKSTDEDIKVLSRAVISDAHTDAEESLTSARTKADEIRKQAMKQAASERARVLEKASAEAERVRSQAIATTQLKARTMQLEQREKLLESVFDSAQQKLSTVQRSTDYEKTAHLLLREALVQLGAKKAVVKADEVTRKFFTSSTIDKIVKDLGIQVIIGEALKQGTGVIVETEDGHRQYDNTLETRLRRMQDTLRSPVHHILMGESL
ncbi:MAG: V-type ATP synthase subunit E family protein [Chloroflexi bacterium]|nr:V-type ATP synthase subunit E family protein [Chloroflexota bacterium]